MWISFFILVLAVWLYFFVRLSIDFLSDLFDLGDFERHEPSHANIQDTISEHLT